jgi:hypothetical protein
VTELKLQRRSVFGWGATSAASAHPTNGMVIHFDGFNQGLKSKPHSDCVSYWKDTRKFHMGSSRGWLDIGYSFAVCPHGYALEGRGVDHEQAAQPGGNRTWYSCTFMSGPAEHPTDEQIAAFRALRSWLRSEHGVGAAVSYHGKFINTDCPGTILKNMVLNGSILTGKISVKEPKPSTGSTAPGFPGRDITQPPVMVGADVKKWQSQMDARGWDILVDGKYGADSESVCRRFQKEKGLKVDGVVGPATWSKSWSAPLT